MDNFNQDFIEIKPEDIKGNIFQSLGQDGAILTAGDKDKFNMMTISWGSAGILWNRNIFSVFVRPQRYTYEFIENSIYFTVSFFNDDFANALNVCGSLSGRDTNKVAAAGLTPVFQNKNCIYFNEARLVFICEKKYFHDITPVHFLDPDIKHIYPEKDYHRMYIGEIIKVLKKIETN